MRSAGDVESSSATGGKTKPQRERKAGRVSPSWYSEDRGESFRCVQRHYDCWRALPRTEDVHLVISLINLRCVILYAMQAAIWLSRVMLCGCFEYYFKEVRMMNRMQCYKLWKDVNELCLQTSWPLFERSGSLNWSKMTEKKNKKKTATLQSLEIKMTASICRTKKEKKCKHYKLLQTLTNHKWN